MTEIPPHVNVSVASFTMLRSRKVVISDGDFFTRIKTLFIALCGRSARLLFGLTNPCVTNIMILCGKTYVLSYTTTRGASLLTVI